MTEYPYTYDDLLYRLHKIKLSESQNQSQSQNQRQSQNQNQNQNQNQIKLPNLPCLHSDKSGENIVYDNVFSLPSLKIYRKNKLSIFSNIVSFSEILNRNKEHIADYFKSETKLLNSINGQNQLVIQGMLNENKCEAILRSYIKSYVLCKQCNCLDTKLVKEHGLTYNKCNKCLASTSLGKINI